MKPTRAMSAAIIRTILLGIVTAFVTAFSSPANAAAPPAAPVHGQWEAVASATDSETDDTQPAVTARGQYIYITLAETTVVRLYTILGQQVSQQTLGPGQWRVRMRARGVYILKAGGATRRVRL